jgi:hypothetical protein
MTQPTGAWQLDRNSGLLIPVVQTGIGIIDPRGLPAGDGAAFLELRDGDRAATAPNGAVRLRSSSAGALQASENGGAWANVTGGGGPSLPTIGYVESLARSTTSTTLIDIPGLNFLLTLTASANIWAMMTFQASSSGGAPLVGGFAVQINAVDGTELERQLSGTADRGLGAAQSKTAAPLAPGGYQVKGRYRRVSGSTTLNIGVSQLVAFAVQ